MKPEIAILFSAISAIAAVGGIVFGWAACAREGKREAQQDAAMSATFRADLEYIRRAVDDIRIEQRAQDKAMNDLTERVTRIEESTRQAHKRLDRFEETMGKDKP